MGLDYLKHKETQRSNLANERETYRSNLANEAERHRSNLANETETNRSNLAREAETNRANLVKEAEIYRSNLQNELLKDKELNIKFQDLGEKIRHNTRSEDLDSLKTTLGALPNSFKGLVGVEVAKQSDPILSELYNRTLSKGQQSLSDFKTTMGGAGQAAANKLNELMGTVFKSVMGYKRNVYDTLGGVSRELRGSNTW